MFDKMDKGMYGLSKEVLNDAKWEGAEGVSNKTKGGFVCSK